MLMQHYRSREELRSIFDIPTREHIRYRCTFVAPWLWKRFPQFAKAKALSWFKSTRKEKDEKREEADKYRLIDFPVWYKRELANRTAKSRGKLVQGKLSQIKLNPLTKASPLQSQQNRKSEEVFKIGYI